MKVAVLGANWSPCAEPIDQTVVPATGLPSPSVQVKAVPPHSWTSIPRWRLYQACSAGASLALKKMPPMPVTRFIEPPRTGGGEGECVFCCLTLRVTCGAGWRGTCASTARDRPYRQVDAVVGRHSPRPAGDRPLPRH